ncbi:MAG: tetratricopeptide repeat protein, partial [Euryarchaeota archaeon]|nr:tetratricopeptide repeat protein [Euryarchaeota archaeon]
MKPRPSPTKTERVESALAALRASPRDPHVWADTGDLLTEAGEFALAIRAYDTALAIDPQFHRAHIGLTITLEISEEDMSRREAPSHLANLWTMLRTLDLLLDRLRSGRRAFIDVQAVRLQRIAERRLANDPDDADALFVRSAFLAREGKFEDAIACLDRLTRTHGDHPGAAEFRQQLG